MSKGGDVLWSPTADQVASAPITALIETVNRRFGRSLATYADLHRWSVGAPSEFWSVVWDAAVGRGSIGDVVIGPGTIESSRFFPEARLNVADELIGAWPDDKVAVIAVAEDGETSQMTRGELREAVSKVAAALLAAGVVPGDRVVAWAPNRAEVLIFALGALRVGAVVSTASPDFAPPAVIERFGQVEPKVLLAVGAYEYNGRTFNVRSRLEQIVAGLPSLTLVVTLDASAENCVRWDEWCVSAHAGSNESELFGFAHPGFILFSSGTTGKPKCIVHSAAGVLLKLHAEQSYNVGLTSDDLLFFYSTTGWMMWNWVLYGLGTGAGVVLFDGHPMYPEPERLFSLAGECGVTVLGVSAKYIDSLRVAGCRPRKDGSPVRVLLSTGSPLSSESFDFVYESCVAPHAHLISMSGGTDICGSFVGGVPTMPVRRGEIQGPVLGMAVDVVDASGTSTSEGVTGELVCAGPFPSIPLEFWGDRDGDRLHQAYFESLPGLWTQGDFALKTPHGGFVILGRSDATLNSNGVRIGTAEIYTVVESVPGVRECMAVTQSWQRDSRIILFVCLTDGVVLDERLQAVIRDRLRAEASPRHVPALIVQAPALPRTRSNKIVELTVADVINGRPVRNRDALDNAEALDWFTNFACSPEMCDE